MCIRDSCGCGRYGCFEAVCGVRAVVERIKASVPDKTLFDLGFQKDRLTISDVLNPRLSELPEVQAVLTDTGKTIGLVIGNMLNLLNTEMVILGGELSRAGAVSYTHLSTAHSVIQSPCIWTLPCSPSVSYTHLLSFPDVDTVPGIPERSEIIRVKAIQHGTQFLAAVCRCTGIIFHCQPHLMISEDWFRCV